MKDKEKLNNPHSTGGGSAINGVPRLVFIPLDDFFKKFWLSLIFKFPKTESFPAALGKLWYAGFSCIYLEEYWSPARLHRSLGC